MAVEIEKMRFCEKCREETVHHIYEDALELEYRCTKCNETTEMVKSFF